MAKKHPEPKQTSDSSRRRSAVQESAKFMTPSSLISAARKAHPAFRYAIAAAGLAGLVVNVVRFGASPATLVFGCIILVVLMVLFLVFAQAAVVARSKMHLPAMLLVYSFLGLSIATASLLFTSSFFDWPLPFRHAIVGLLPTVGEIPPAAGESGLAEQASQTLVEVAEIRRVLDLRDWRYVPPASIDEKVSRGVFADTYWLKKASDTGTYFLCQHGTTGLTVDFESDSHPIMVEPFEKEQLPGHPLLKQFDVYLDISDEPADTLFKAELVATYWNAFNSSTTAWTGIPIVHPTGRVRFEVIFPPGKEPTDVDLAAFRRVAGSQRETIGSMDDLEVNGNSFVWTIEDPGINMVYEMIWEW